jgi:hypothetical protein
MPVPADDPGPRSAQAIPERELGLLGRLGVLLSAFLVLGGLVASAAWINRPGAVGGGSSSWPAASRLERSDSEHTLVLFAHPHCPCTAATLRELERIAARCRDRAKVLVVFSTPQDAPEGWEQGSLWERARALPDVTVVRDLDGLEARRFGARISGSTLLFDRRGSLRFSGGITAARGHEGDNSGSSAIVDLVLEGATESPATPVFGCPLFDDELAAVAGPGSEPVR